MPNLSAPPGSMYKQEKNPRNSKNGRPASNYQDPNPRYQNQTEMK
jgi:hypothetical protein